MKLNPTLFGFFRKELTQTLRDKRMWQVLFIMPVIQLLLFGYAITTEMKNIRLAAVYKPEDSLCQRFADRCYASGWFIPPDPGNGDPFGWVRSGRADAVLVAPEGGLTQAVQRGKGEIQFLINAGNVLKAQAVENYAQAILAQTLAAEKLPAAPAPPLTIEARVLYNPEMQTPAYMVPGVLCQLLLILTMVLASTAITREKETGTFETLIASPAKAWEIILGKTMPYVLVAMVDGPVILMVAMMFFKVPMRGSYSVLFLSILIFTFTTVFIAILVSTMAKNQQQAMMAGFLVNFPFIQLSGVMFPVQNMPLLVKWLAYLDPLMYFVELLRNIMLKGGDLRLVLGHLGALLLIAVPVIYFSFRRFRQTLN